jgi:hypothetical protein
LSKKILKRFVEGIKYMKGCTCIGYLKWKKVIPSFEYEVLVFFSKPET